MQRSGTGLHVAGPAAARPARLPRVPQPRAGLGRRCSPTPAACRRRRRILGIPCFTLRDNTERPITCELGTNVLLGLAPERIREVPGLIAAGTARGERASARVGRRRRRPPRRRAARDRSRPRPRGGRRRLLLGGAGAAVVTPPATSARPGLAAQAANGASALLAQAALQDWRGPDPYDGLYFPWPAWLTSGAAGVRPSSKPTPGRRLTFAACTGVRTRGSPRRWPRSAPPEPGWPRPGTRRRRGSGWRRSSC